MTGIGIFSALAFVATLLLSPLPPVAGFLSIDVKDAVITIASFIYGPVSAVVIPLTVSLVEWFTVSTTGWYGFIMNFVSSAVFALVATLIYNKRRSLNMALIAFFFATCITTTIMLLLNLCVTPLYLTQVGMSMTSRDVAAMIPKVLLPFNFAKALLNSGVAMLLYKPVLSALSGSRLIQRNQSFVFNKNSVIIMSVGLAVLIFSVVILLVI